MLFGYSAILFTEGDLGLSYSLKRVCEHHKVNLLYVQSYHDVISSLINIRPNFVFLDISLVNTEPNFKDLSDNPYLTKVAFVTTKDKEHNLAFECLKISEVNDFLKAYDDSVICQNLKRLDYENQINNLLIDIGVSPNHVGKDYLFECINMTLQDKQKYNCLNKDCYPVIAIKHDTSACNVERNIRHAILTAWARKEETKWDDILKDFDPNLKLSNRQFIHLCAEVVRAKNENFNQELFDEDIFNSINLENN